MGEAEAQDAKSVWKLFSLEGKVAIITGATGGIGVEIASAYAEAGADLALWYTSSTEADALCDKLQDRYKIRAKVYKVPLDKSETVDAAVQDVVKEFGRLDVMVINAGISAVAGLLDTSDELWHRVMDVNLHSAMYCARAAGRVFKSQKAGSLIATSSISAHIVNKPQIATAYNASKAGLLHFTKTVAIEFAQFGARANCEHTSMPTSIGQIELLTSSHLAISPGYVLTSINSQLPEELLRKWEEYTPMHRQAQPWELKGAFLFLASDASSFVTGTDLLVDGGYTSY